ncbi:DUF370 domain-containing protein [Salicibibacter halophilus]|uniref:DUF370 domain-containing protein n=1 Tax=Salicibibacter halophilus TaxID=2502791 RepID=A0A514LGY7_9BACI|nr:extracellular matrix/biofilm biosynthesis regulator RemA family protein [Salicibibacter halophilus]QDI90805.1 DUF370 domain-containing protein [Salicibibacter halophilus]
MTTLKIGHGNIVIAHRVLAIEEATKESVRRIMRKEQDENRLVDGTAGHKTHSLIFMNSGHVVASAIRKKTLIRRFKENHNGKKEGKNHTDSG